MKKREERGMKKQKKGGRGNSRFKRENQSNQLRLKLNKDTQFRWQAAYFLHVYKLVFYNFIEMIKINTLYYSNHDDNQFINQISNQKPKLKYYFKFLTG